MADAVLGYVVQRVGDLLIDEAKFLFAVRDEVEWVKRELRAMQCFLKDADARSRTGDERVKNWVREVREIAYQAEDLVESFVVDAERRRRRRKGFLRTTVCCRLPSPNGFILLHRFGGEIEAIKARIREINERRSTYGIEDLGGEKGRQIDETVRDRRRAVLHAPDPDLVGMDEEKNRIVKHLLDGSRKKRSVISIVGMGGLGKTTLAKRVFNAARVDFSHSVWIDVSQQYSAEDLLRKILRQVTGLEEEKLKKMTRDDCEAKLYPTLQAEKYLIVMDDVWETKVWRFLSRHLPDAENGSRVLITTRSLDVAKAADASTPPLELRLLTEEESWELLSKKAFPNHEDIEAVCSEPLREVGKQIARKCGGLPLALVVLGGLLSTKGQSLRAWRKLAETLVWENIEEGRVCMDILALSYDELPRHLKCCFLYFSSLPEDFEIAVDKLIRLWIAEGFVEYRAGETLEETAEGYLEELVQRCLVMPVRVELEDIWFSRESELRCRIHDLLRDFTIAEAKEVGFLVCDRTEEDRGTSNLDSSVRRLSLQGDKAWSWNSKSTPRLRTLLSFSTLQKLDLKRTFPIRDLKLLRVVNLEGAPVTKLPKQIGDLIHLRYLGLKYTSIQSLPSSVGKLRHLQCLDAEGTWIKTPPRSVWKIEALRQVIIYSDGGVKPKMVDGGLRNLQVLKEVRAGSWIDGCLGSLTNLRELQIAYIKDCHHPALSSCLPRLPRLKKLSLEGASIPDCLWTPSSFSSLEVLGLYGVVRRPQKSSPGGHQWPPNLTQLGLYYTGLGQDSIAALENLPALTSLALGFRSYEGNELICSRGGFQRLESLALRLHELERWVIEAGAMPRLRILDICGCEKLATLPEGLQHMAALEELVLSEVSPGLYARTQKGGEDWPKIQHIPSINILDKTPDARSPA